LCGLRPYEDVDIVFTGIRPGEKLREEILTPHELDNPNAHASENPTVHERLFVAQQERIVYERLVDVLSDLDIAVKTPDPQAVVAMMCRLVPTFQPGSHLQGQAVDASDVEEPGVERPRVEEPSLEQPQAAETASAAEENAPAGNGAIDNVVLLEDAIAARGAATDASSQAEVGAP
jgi:hypothetical protein